MRKWLIAAGVCLLALGAAGVIVAKRLLPRLPDYLKSHVESTLGEHFASDVQFTRLQISVYSKIVIRGEGLVLRLHGRTDVPPLITVDRCSTELELWELLEKTRHVKRIALDGLKITMPPPVVHPPGAPPKKSAHKHLLSPGVLVDEIDADGAELDLLVRDPNKPPHVFYIRHLVLRHAGAGEPMGYEAVLTNPVPTGEIQAKGMVGPWVTEEPRLTPVSGAYTFSNVDLASIHGLGGTLTSKGKFSGPLDRIAVDGTTTTPDFSLEIGGRALPLTTQFHAIVDGTTGNTLLEPVHARLASSEITARGGVLRLSGQLSRKVQLQTTSKNARIEDMLRLALKTEPPPMTGAMAFQIDIDIPPGKTPIADRMILDGNFHIDSAVFARGDIQDKVAALSRRGSGERAEQETEKVASDFSGDFQLQEGLLTFSRLTFGVPGAAVNLAGTYTLRGQDIDFSGALGLEAKLSQMVKGWKSVLLLPVDPLFSKDGAGTLVPITITGTADDPHFSVDIHRIFHKQPRASAP